MWRRIISLKRLSKSEYAKSHRAKYREEVIELLGGSCSCGFDDARALQVDHVNGGGSKEREEQKYSYTKLRNAVREDVKNKGNKYQLLCANCNWIKRHENKEMG